MTTAANSAVQETTVTTRPGSRSEAFTTAVSDKKLKTSSRDGTVRVLGLVAMIAGVAGAFVAYQLSTGLDDSRDIASAQILALAFVSVGVLGVGLYVAGSLSQLMRLWLLRQVVESQERHDELLAALRDRQL